MDIEREVQIIAYEIQTGKEDFVKGAKRILALFSVVGRSEQLVCSCGSIKVQTTGGLQCPNNRCSLAN